MCGIYGRVGKTSTCEIVDKLEMLEYRGYDSCGIALIEKGKAFIYKACGNTSGLKNIVDKHIADLCISHTRWATHGEVSLVNAHPHTTQNNRFIIVHNGVIDNYQKLKEEYSIKTISQTDTEVIVHLLDKFSLIYSDLLEAIKELMKIIEGSYAILIIDKKSDKLYFMKNKSSLLIAKDKNGISIASDQIVFENSSNVLILNDFDYGYIKEDIFVCNIFNNNTRNEFIKSSNRSLHKTTSHYMLDEILYEPTMINKISEEYKKIDLSKLNDLFNKADEICFVGAGSSFYAGAILKHKYEQILNKRCYAVVASEIASFVITNPSILFIFLTQSGETLDLCAAQNMLGGKYKIVALCNNVNSTIAYNADVVIPLFAGEEIAVASTKAFMAMVYVGEIIINPAILLEKDSIVEKLNTVIEDIRKVEEAVETITNVSSVFYLGKGIDYQIALEAALKLREVSYINSFAFYSGELKHGSIALLDENTLCIGILQNDDFKNSIDNALEEARARRSKTMLIEGDLYSIIMKIELLAYYIALKLNRNIDQPRNLAKSVTVN